MFYRIAALLLVGTSVLFAADREEARLSREAYRLLQADDELADLNLGVRVEEQGVLIIWGPVPTKAMALKAEKTLQSLRGVRGIKNQCEVAVATDAFVKDVQDVLQGKKPTSRPISELPPDPPQSPLSDPLQTTVLKPVPEAAPVANRATAEPVARLLAPQALPADTVDHHAIASLRQSQLAYQQLQLELRDGAIVIRSGKEPAVAWEFARKISPYAGNRRVIVENVTAK